MYEGLLVLNVHQLSSRTAQRRQLRLARFVVVSEELVLYFVFAVLSQDLGQVGLRLSHVRMRLGLKFDGVRVVLVRLERFYYDIWQLGLATRR